MLSNEEFQFIDKNKAEDAKSLALKAHGKFIHSMGFLLNQIKLRQKTKKKLPTWFENTRLLFPTNLSSEQCSSETTADYKATLFHGQSFIDLTAGMGIDALSFSKNFEKGICLEQNQELANVTKHNFETLKVNHFELVEGSGIAYLSSTSACFDLIYIDPDRRPSDARVYDFSDCEPNILEHLDLLLQKGKNILIKASPMLNVDSCVEQLKNVAKIIVVSYKNECKEILFVLEQEYTGNPKIEAIELDTQQCLSVDYPVEEQEIILSSVATYLYDPYVAFRKAGLTDELAKKHGLTRFNATSSLLTSTTLISGFEGRIFKVLKTIAADKKAVKKEGIKRANIITRGFFLSSDQLHEQLKLGRGGNTFLVASKNSQGKVEMIICEKFT